MRLAGWRDVMLSALPYVPHHFYATSPTLMQRRFNWCTSMRETLTAMWSFPGARQLIFLHFRIDLHHV
jgi:hypothetical protein